MLRCDEDTEVSVDTETDTNPNIHAHIDTNVNAAHRHKYECRDTETSGGCGAPQHGQGWSLERLRHQLAVEGTIVMMTAFLHRQTGIVGFITFQNKSVPLRYYNHEKRSALGMHAFLFSFCKPPCTCARMLVRMYITIITHYYGTLLLHSS
jgi:hypothetical protein